MRSRLLISALIVSAGLLGSLGNGPVSAQDTNRPDVDADRYMLVEAGAGYLRLDRTTGRVAECRKRGASWQCLPTPDAQSALETEIERLGEQLTRLRAENADLKSDLSALRGAETGNAETGDSSTGRETAQAPDSGPVFTPEEEAELDKALDFTERAMRRFFGMMKTLRDEYDSLGQ